MELIWSLFPTDRPPFRQGAVVRVSKSCSGIAVSRPLVAPLGVLWLSEKALILKLPLWEADSLVLKESNHSILFSSSSCCIQPSWSSQLQPVLRSGSFLRDAAVWCEFSPQSLIPLCQCIPCTATWSCSEVLQEMLKDWAFFSLWSLWKALFYFSGSLGNT